MANAKHAEVVGQLRGVPLWPMSWEGVARMVPFKGSICFPPSGVTGVVQPVWARGGGTWSTRQCLRLLASFAGVLAEQQMLLELKVRAKEVPRPR